MLTAIMNELNYVGVMAMECFVTAEGLLINELAPRVHNSGHWTQNGASISQFELHLRAITGLPLPPPVVNSPSVMINLIGTDLNYDWLKLPLVHLHWYDKEVRPGRKVGHLNLTDSDTDRLSATLEAIAAAAGVHQRPVLGAIAAQLSPSCRDLIYPLPRHTLRRVQSPCCKAHFCFDFRGYPMTNGTDYRAILASDTPLIDVRAPVEFSQSAMPAAINLPLMNDEERAAVGTCYKRQGPEAALALGHKLVR